MKCDRDVRPDLFHNIILSGGSTMFPGIKERFQTEMLHLTRNFKVLAPPERKYSAWIGGSIVGSISCFVTRWMTKEEYDDTGPSLVHRRCL